MRLTRTRTTSKTTTSPLRPESGGVSAVFGVLAVYLFGFVVIALGLVYLFLPTSPDAVGPPVPAAAPPPDLPSDVERPKNLQDVLNEQQKDGVPVKGGLPKFVPPRGNPLPGVAPVR